MKRIVEFGHAMINAIDGDALLALGHTIDGFYNPRRKHSTGLSITHQIRSADG